MGVVLHSTLPYLSDAELVRPPAWVFLLFIFIHIWKMPLFFILAGFFPALSLQRKATSSFAWDGFYRIALPLILWFFFDTENLIAGLKGDWSELSYDHLWFLYYLLAMYLIALAIAPFAPK